MLIDEAKYRNVIFGYHLLYRSFKKKYPIKRIQKLPFSMPSIFDNLSSIYFKFAFFQDRRLFLFNIFDCLYKNIVHIVCLYC